MADQDQQHHVEVTGADQVDFQERGLFDFGKKKEEKKVDEEQVLVSEMNKVNLEEANKPEEHEKPGSLLEKLHRSHSTSSSSSSDEEEVDENGEKRKKKKGLKEKIKERVTGEKKEGEETVVTGDDSAIKVEKVEDASLKVEEEVPAEEKKGFLEKIKEKLPMQSKKPAEEVVVVSAPAETHKEQQHDEEGQAKKGFLEKIKEKLPGYHKIGGEEAATAATTTNSGAH